MTRDATYISLDEFIENCVKVGLPASKALEQARRYGYRVRNGVFYAAYRKAKRQWSR